MYDFSRTLLVNSCSKVQSCVADELNLFVLQNEDEDAHSDDTNSNTPNKWVLLLSCVCSQSQTIPSTSHLRLHVHQSAQWTETFNWILADHILTCVTFKMVKLKVLRERAARKDCLKKGFFEFVCAFACLSWKLNVVLYPGHSGTFLSR